MLYLLYFISKVKTSLHLLKDTELVLFVDKTWIAISHESCELFSQSRDDFSETELRITAVLCYLCLFSNAVFTPLPTL